MELTDRILNLLIFLIMCAILLRFSRAEGRWNGPVIKKAFRFFTVQSNAFCAAAAGLLCLFPAASWAWLLKYIGTAAVTVTMLTVFLFLGPSIGGYRDLLRGSDLFMHLINPLLALISFCVLERRGLRFSLSLTGLLPVALYGALYGWKILLAPPEKAWEDFYGFNKNGKWQVSVLAMLGGAFLICLALMAIQNL